MAYTMHWIAERRHPDGCWEAVISNLRVRELYPDLQEERADIAAALSFGARDLAWFHELAGLTIRPEDDDGTPQLATPGLPADASQHTRDVLAGDRAAAEGFQVLRPRPFRNAGWITYAILSGDSEHLGFRRRRALAQVKEIISGPAPTLLETEILRGPARRLPGQPRHPEMASASAHLRLADHARLSELEPISFETLRFVFAFGA